MIVIRDIQEKDVKECVVIANEALSEMRSRGEYFTSPFLILFKRRHMKQ